METQNEMMAEMARGALYSQSRAKAYLSKVYAWMSVTMLVTVAVSVYSTHDMELMRWILEHLLLLGISSLVIVLIMAYGSLMLSYSLLVGLLMAYATVTGLIFGPVLMAYTQQTLTLAFACTAGTFGVMAFIGACTKKNLSTMGGALMMSLIGLIIASIINCFWGNGMMDFIICCAGVLIFSLFTAYDTQKLLEQGMKLEGEHRKKMAILGALTLYLDFINLFIYILRLLARRD